MTILWLVENALLGGDPLGGIAPSALAEGALVAFGVAAVAGMVS